MKNQLQTRGVKGALSVNFLKKIVWMFGVAAAVALPTMASAQSIDYCSVHSNPLWNGVPFELPLTLVGTLNTKVAVGQVMGKASVESGYPNWGQTLYMLPEYFCPIVNAYNTTGTLNFNAWGAPVSLPGIPNVYATNVPGVGYTIRFEFSNAISPGYDAGWLTPWPVALQQPISDHWIPRGAAYVYPVNRVTATFYRIPGELQAGVITGRLGQSITPQAGVPRVLVNYGIGNGNGPPIPVDPPRKPTCAVNGGGMNFQLGNINATDFRGMNTTAGRTPLQNLTLNCTGGDEGETTNVYVTLTDQSNPANVTTVLPNMGQSGKQNATGVGLQLLRDGNAVNYGPTSSNTGPSQWMAGTVGNSNLLIPLQAQMIQTDSMVKGGIVYSAATITLTYR